MRRQLTLLCVATQFLTRLPVPALRDFEPRWLGESTRYFPLVGLAVGVLNALVWAACIRVLPDVVAVGLMLGFSLLLTGAFHEDGFADTCDGFGGGTTRERTLAIMKDSRIGAYGALGIVMLLGLKWTVLTALPQGSVVLMLSAAHMWSRFCSLALIWRLPYVRSDEGAKALPFEGSLSGAAWLLAGALGVLGLVPVALACEALIGPQDVRALLLAAAAAAVITVIAALRVRRRIGGYTGDCLGATQQLAELAFLVTGLAQLARLPA